VRFLQRGEGEVLFHEVRHHLPRQAEPVFEPAALLSGGVAALGELVPVAVGFRLVLAEDLERDGLVELENRPPGSTCSTARA